MKKMAFFTAIVFLALATSSSLVAGKISAKAEEYHHALILCYQHSADHAKALYNQVAIGELNLDIAQDFLQQIESDLDHARVYHAMVHKTYSEADVKAISAEHLVILGAQATAVTALASLKAELAKANPNIATINTLATVIFDATMKAVNAHRGAMRKLGVPEGKVPTA